MATIRENHRLVREIADEIAALCQGASPQDMTTLADARWRFTRQILMAITLHDQVIYAHLEECGDPETEAVVRSFREEQERLQPVFREHMLRWSAEAVESEWQAYRTALHHILVILHDRMDREENTLYPVAEKALPKHIGKKRTARNWARDAWDIRSAIG